MNARFKMSHFDFQETVAGYTVFHYGKVTFRENMDTMHLIFAFYVLESPVMKRKKLEKNTDFKKYAGDLLMEIMSANIDEDIIDEIGNNNTEESDI